VSAEIQIYKLKCSK